MILPVSGDEGISSVQIFFKDIGKYETNINHETLSCEDPGVSWFFITRLVSFGLFTLLYNPLMLEKPAAKAAKINNGKQDIHFWCVLIGKIT